MRRTWIGLECDDERCSRQFPLSTSGAPQPEDGAIFTFTMLRAEAAKLGWQRYGGQDYCPECEIKHRNAAARAKGGN